jgi:hypothetical protein
MSYSSSVYEMVITTLLDCYRWKFSGVVQRRGIPPPVWKRRQRARASSAVDVRGGGALLGRVGAGRLRDGCAGRVRSGGGNSGG